MAHVHRWVDLSLDVWWEGGESRTVLTLLRDAEGTSEKVGEWRVDGPLMLEGMLGDLLEHLRAAARALVMSELLVQPEEPF